MVDSAKRQFVGAHQYILVASQALALLLPVQSSARRRDSQIYLLTHYMYKRIISTTLRVCRTNHANLVSIDAPSSNLHKEAGGACERLQRPRRYE